MHPLVRSTCGGWLFPGEAAVLEFVYPKGDAVAIAKSNNAKVPAIDPVSEGRPEELKGLSKTDLELVTLWLLSSTQVGPGDSAAGHSGGSAIQKWLRPHTQNRV